MKKANGTIEGANGALKKANALTLGSHGSHEERQSPLRGPMPPSWALSMDNVHGL